MKKVDLIELESRKKGVVVDILGGRGLGKTLETLGIRVGCVVEKISSHVMRGPAIVKIGNAKVAIGYGMAKKIIVKGQSDVAHKNTGAQEHK